MHIFTLLFLFYLLDMSYSSSGDRSWVFNKCEQACSFQNCSNYKVINYEQSKPFYMYFWSCFDECKYICMWKTVDAFKRDNSKIPQFYGKWPFIRIFGCQEPASALFSVLNGLPHILMIIKFRNKFQRFTPMYYPIHIYALVGTIVWSFSTIFHIKDTQLTEALDYFGAIGLMLIQFWLFIIRINFNSNLKFYWNAGFSGALLSFYIYHIYCMWYIHFDYSYNMKVNVFIGFLNSIGWLLFSVINFTVLKYVWKAAVVVFSLNILILLELFDFPPIFWILDAHSLWHLGTIPLPILWYKFLFDDCNYLQKLIEKID